MILWTQSDDGNNTSLEFEVVQLKEGADPSNGSPFRSRPVPNFAEVWYHKDQLVDANLELDPGLCGSTEHIHLKSAYCIHDRTR
jgi:hypothetical protein